MSVVDDAVKQRFARYSAKQPDVKPLTPEPWVYPHVDPLVVIVSRYPVHRLIKPPDPTRDSLAQHYQEDTNLITVVIPGPGGIGLYELARWYVPFGRIGVVRQAWQWLELQSPPASPPVIGTPYDALSHTRDTGGNPVNVLWKLRLIQGKKNGPLDVLSTGSRPPGYGFHDFPNWSELRFPWGSNAPVFWLVHEHFTLSLYADIQQGLGFVKSIGARLSGYTQTITKYAQHNTRHGWQW